MNIASAIAVYQNLGWDVTPVNVKYIGGKKKIDFFVKWKDASKEDLVKCFEKNMDRINSLCVRTGKKSNLFVVDCDSEAAVESFRDFCPIDVLDIPCVSTVRGAHFYFEYPDKADEYESTTASRKDLDIDTRGEGGMVIIPPSEPTGGKKYKWHGDYNKLQQPPKDLLDWLLTKKKKRVQSMFRPRRSKMLGVKDYQKEKLQQKLVNCANASKGTRSERDFDLVCYAYKLGYTRDEIFNMLKDVGKTAEKGKYAEKYFDKTYNNAVRTADTVIQTTSLFGGGK